MANRPKPLVLLILDGFGLRVERDNSAIALANTPYWERMQQEYPIVALDCSRDGLGLPADQMGNSEQGAFFRNSGLCRNIGKAIVTDNALVGVHRHDAGIMAGIRLAAKQDLKKIYLHTFAWDASIKAVKAIDGCLESIVTALKQLGGRLLLAVGHGNIKQLIDAESGRVQTAHTMNLVSLMPVGDSKPLQDGGNLADLALTMRVILGVQQSVEMTGRSLIG